MSEKNIRKTISIGNGGFVLILLCLVLVGYGIFTYADSRPVFVDFEADCTISDWKKFDMLLDTDSGELLQPVIDLKNGKWISEIPDNVHCRFRGKVAGPRSVMAAMR